MAKPLYSFREDIGTLVCDSLPSQLKEEKQVEEEDEVRSHILRRINERTSLEHLPCSIVITFFRVNEAGYQLTEGELKLKKAATDEEEEEIRVRERG